MLARGGLHHDSAVLYRDKVGDRLKAAEQFEAAGEFDEALRILDLLADHERAAGDLLRRMGDEDRAVERYVQAAEMIRSRAHGSLAAGEFILKKTSRTDLAESYFAVGWAGREIPSLFGDWLPCGLHLARIYSERQRPDEFMNLVRDGESFFSNAGNQVAAGQFFNEVARLTSSGVLEPYRDELRDRCLMGLAGKLREYADSNDKPGTVVSTLFGEMRVWETGGSRRGHCGKGPAKTTASHRFCSHVAANVATACQHRHRRPHFAKLRRHFRGV